MRKSLCEQFTITERYIQHLLQLSQITGHGAKLLRTLGLPKSFSPNIQKICYRYPSSSMTGKSVKILSFITFKDQCCIVTTEAKVIGHDRTYFHLTSFVRHYVQVTFGILVVDIDRRRNHTVPDRQCGDDRLDPSGCTEQVPRHRL